MDGLGVEARIIDVPNSPSPMALRRAARQLKALVEESGPFDVIHAHGLKAGWVVHAAGYRSICVLTLHNVVLDEVAGRKAELMRRLERLVISRSAAVVAVSGEIARRFETAAPTRVSVILPASPRPVPTMSKSEVRAAHDTPEDVRVVSVIARLHPQKDIPMFLDAWERVHLAVPTAIAWIVGDGPERESIEVAVRDERLGGSVMLLGASPFAVNEIAASDLIAMSSRWEGAPLTVAEAMQLGIPIVATDVGAVAETVGDTGTIVAIGDSRALGEAIIDMLTDEPKRLQLGAAAAARGNSLYGPEPLVRSLSELYEQVVGA
jgi:glycosyltransferase involved in cell wall biosynthesis